MSLDFLLKFRTELVEDGVLKGDPSTEKVCGHG